MKRFVIEKIVNDYDTWDEAMDKYHHKNGLWIPSLEDDKCILYSQIVTHPDFVSTGFRDTNGSFGSCELDAYFWLSSKADASSAWSRYLNYSKMTEYRYALSKAYGFSVALIREE